MYTLLSLVHLTNVSNPETVFEFYQGFRVPPIMSFFAIALWVGTILFIIALIRALIQINYIYKKIKGDEKNKKCDGSE